MSLFLRYSGGWRCTRSMYSRTYCWNRSGTSSRLISPPVSECRPTRSRVSRAQLLPACRNLNHHLAGHVLRTLSDDLGQLAHGLQLFGFFEGFDSVLTSDAGF